MVFFSESIKRSKMFRNPKDLCSIYTNSWNSYDLRFESHGSNERTSEKREDMKMREYGEDERRREKMRGSEEKREKIRVRSDSDRPPLLLYWSEPNWFSQTGLVHS
jgi:hypothetical protein